jgi:hypothetical protein
LAEFLGIPAVGAMVMVPTIQRDLGNKANAQLAEAGIDARIDFHGQDGTLRCVRQLDDPEAARAVAGEVDGVRSVALDISCTTPAATLPIDTTLPPVSSRSARSLTGSINVTAPSEARAR